MPRSKNAVASRARRKKILDQAKGYYGKRKNVYTVAKNIVENLVSKFPKLSLKMMAPESKISKSTTRKVLIDDLKRKLYKIKVYRKPKKGKFLRNGSLNC